jgi:predicted transcriptional regulator
MEQATGVSERTVWTELLLMSIKPRWARSIIAGSKTVELRRGAPRVRLGQPVLLYSTMPEGRVIGWCRISSIMQACPDDMWLATRGRADLVKDEFTAYFTGSATAVGIELRDAHELRCKPTLADLRAASGFHPPQTWRFLDKEQIAAMLDGHDALTELLPLFGGALDPA